MATIRKREDRAKPWQVRYRDPDGVQRSQSFTRKAQADAYLVTMESDKLRGTYLDPQAGKVTLRTFGDQWLAAQTFDVATRAAVTSRLKCHVYPTLGKMELRAIKPSTVQAWMRGMSANSAPRTVRVVLANLSAIMGAAVEDGVIVSNPCAARSVRAPALDGRRVVPWTREQVDAVTKAHRGRYGAVPVVGAGLGLRQGEVFGLRVEDIDFLRRRVLVRQQLKLVKGRPIFAAPKGRREREVPLSDVVAVALAEQLRAWPALEVTLPWGDLDGETRTASLVFSTREHGPVIRNHYNPWTWKPALVAAGIEPTRANGMHALRHFYASALLDGGTSINAVADYLGHADPGFTLRVYTHLMPAAEDRARSAIDAALGPRVAQEWPKGAQDGS